jgi:hypothetical protein
MKTTGVDMILTLCGSGRFEKEFKELNELLSLKGHSVFSLAVYPSDKKKKDWYSAVQKLILDGVHFDKIKRSHAIVVVNVYGYVGESTLKEIAYARKLKKGLYALESWGKGLGICDMHTDKIQAACRKRVPEYKGAPIDFTTRNGFVGTWAL